MGPLPPRAEAIPMAVATWIAYLCVHFVLVPGWFAWRFRRSPYALRWLPRNGYDLGESAYGLLVAVYTLAVLLGPLTKPRWTVLVHHFDEETNRELMRRIAK